jgi:two-component system, cell cycle response regulator CpdR
MGHILLAAHNKSVATVLYATLKKAGHTIEKVGCSLDAWRNAQKGTFDIVMIDVMMPGIDGFVLAQRALQENPFAQIVFITGFAAVAMDTFATPVYAPAPMTSRPFHIRDMPARLAALAGNGFAAEHAENMDKTAENNVIYANFSAQQASAAERA